MAEGGKDRPKSPYDGLEARAFWRSGVAEAGAWPPPDLFRPRFPIPRTARILTAGSCFAQHVGKALRANGFSVIDAEPMTASVPPEVAQAYGYGLYSARYGNIYTVRQLLQLLREDGGISPLPNPSGRAAGGSSMRCARRWNRMGWTVPTRWPKRARRIWPPSAVPWPRRMSWSSRWA